MAIPAALGLVASALSLSGLADRSEQAVYAAMIETRVGRQLAESVTTLERNARQYAILDDRELLDAYANNRRVFLEVAKRLLDSAATPPERQALERALDAEAQIFDALARRDATGEARAAAIAGFDALDERIRAVQRATAARIDEEVEALRATAVRARRVALSQLAVLLTVIVLLVGGFAMLIARPIRELDGAIRRLGRGQLAEPVRISGPDDLAELGERLDGMRRDLVRLEQDKNRFLREIAHALKTPLTALRDGAELLRAGGLGKLDAGQLEVAEIMSRNALELQHLVVGLLQYGQAQFGRTSLELEPVWLPDLVTQTAEPHRLASRSGGLRLDIAADPVRIRVDPGKLRPVLDNLLSNAVKYSPAGGQVRVVARHRERRLVVEVSDEGPGIAQEERDRIFDPFVQGRSVSSGLVPGSGIGLSIAREHVMAHGGSIELVDRERGACFRVTVPAQAA